MRQRDGKRRGVEEVYEGLKDEEIGKKKKDSQYIITFFCLQRSNKQIFDSKLNVKVLIIH